MPGSWTHLASRFFGAIRARDLARDQHEWLSELLSAPELELFMEQPVIDRRHGYESARTMSSSTEDRDLVKAAALHDVGKRHARLGVLGRSIASVLIKLRMPLWGRFRMYRDHPSIGASDLGDVGSPAVVVSFAMTHHHARPADIDERTWRLLLAADNEPERSQSVRSDQ